MRTRPALRRGARPGNGARLRRRRYPDGLLVALALLGSGSIVLGRQAYLGAKAVLAERLISRAFEANLRDGRPHRPWSWADIHPVARLEVERLGVRRFVLSGASGASLAFGVGHIDGTALPGEPGNCVLAGHRDRWFAFLQDLQPGDRLGLETVRGRRDYLVHGMEVVSRDAAEVLRQPPDDRLTLVTCWPFGGLLRSPWRYLVTLRPSTPHPPPRLPEITARASGSAPS